VVDGNVSDKCPEAEFRIIRSSMNRRNNLPKFFERLFSHVVVAEGNVEIHVTSRLNIALWARTYCSKFNLTTVETKCPRHIADIELKGRKIAITQLRVCSILAKSNLQRESEPFCGSPTSVLRFK
jgi:hypothetical protein